MENYEEFFQTIHAEHTQDLGKLEPCISDACIDSARYCWRLVFEFFPRSWCSWSSITKTRREARNKKGSREEKQGEEETKIFSRSWQFDPSTEKTSSCWRNPWSSYLLFLSLCATMKTASDTITLLSSSLRIFLLFHPACLPLHVTSFFSPRTTIFEKVGRCTLKAARFHSLLSTVHIRQGILATFQKFRHA